MHKIDESVQEAKNRTVGGGMQESSREESKLANNRPKTGENRLDGDMGENPRSVGGISSFVDMTSDAAGSKENKNGPSRVSA